REHPEIDGYVAAIQRVGLPPSYMESVEDFLRISQEPLQALATAQNGAGAIWLREAVPKDLRNIVILDASQPIRELVAMDPTIEAVRDRESLIRDPLKTFENVTVTQIKSAGGRHKIETSAAANH